MAKLRWGLTILLVLLGACTKSDQAGSEEIPIPVEDGNASVKQAAKHVHIQPYVRPNLPGHSGGQRVGVVPAVPVQPSLLRRQAAPNGKVELRLLLISATAGENELLTWKQVLDRFGTPYDTLIATSEPPLTPERLTQADGTGRYQAILLTTNNLSYDSGGGNFISAFDATEWATLFQYERDYKVRQVALYGAPGTFPEDYCVRPAGEQAVEGTEFPIRMTSTGAGIFNYLRSDAQIPLRFSYLYKGSLDAACAATNPTQVILQDAAGAVLGVRSTTSDGRERLMLQFSSNPFFFYTPMVAYGVIRWATRGIFIGERQHFLHVDNDDWFNSTDWRLANGTFVPGGFRLSASDAVSTYNQLRSFRSRWGRWLENISNFNINIAYNADGSDATAPYSCTQSVSSPDPLSSVSRCLSTQFRWLNHSLTHLNMDQPRWAPFATARFEIQENLRAGARLGIFPPTDVLKPGELSGLGFFDPNRTDPYGDIGTPQDFGLGASNREFLRAAKDASIKVIHSNFSVASQKPSCHNCGIWHPLEPSLFLIPVRPNNVAFYVTTPDEETSFFNLFYGPGGLFPTFPQNLNYTQILDYNSEVAFFNLITGAVYADYFHQGNLREYASGKNLMFDWMNALMERYSRYYNIPVRNLIWSTGFNSISTYVQARTSHTNMAPRVKAIWDRSASTRGRVTVSAPSNQGGWVFVTGAQEGFQHVYGGDPIGGLYLNPGQSIGLNPVLKP